MQKKLALVADDMAINRVAIKGFLTIIGLEVELAEDGLIASKMIDKKKYDVIFSDIEMPNMNGYELLRTVKRHPLNGSTPVIMLSTLNKPEDIDKAKKLGANFYMVKPFSADGVKNALKSLNIIQ